MTTLTTPHDDYYLISTDEGRHGRPDTTRVLRHRVTGHYRTTRYHGGSAVAIDDSTARPAGCRPIEQTVTIDLPPGDDRIEAAWHGRCKAFAQEVPSWAKVIRVKVIGSIASNLDSVVRCGATAEITYTV